MSRPVLLSDTGHENAGGSTTYHSPAPDDVNETESGYTGGFLRFPGSISGDSSRSYRHEYGDLELNARREATTGNIVRSVKPFTGRGSGSTIFSRKPGTVRSNKLRLKKPRNGKEASKDMPPTPWGCEWREVEDGWNLWRYWTEKDLQAGDRIKKERYVGSLTREAWQVLKGYDNETIISIIGERFRRHGRS